MRSRPRAGSRQLRATSPAPPTSTARAITSLHQISVDQKDLSDLDKRIQDQDDLATAYGNWVDVVKVRQRAVVHDMLQSAMLILLVVFGGVSGATAWWIISSSDWRWNARDCILCAE